MTTIEQFMPVDTTGMHEERIIKVEQIKKQKPKYYRIKRGLLQCLGSSHEIICRSY